MIDKAKEQFSDIEFKVCDALALPFAEEFDVVFSNAVFHWISDHDTLLKNIHKALKPQGLLVCEFGASGNIAMIESAFVKACSGMGDDYEPKFNFPKTDDLIFEKVVELTRGALWNGAEWVADYRRLRAIAHI